MRWTAVDDNTASATVNDGDVSATLVFRFDSGSGLIDSVRAEARGRTLGDKVVPTSWEGRWSNYAERGGMMVPLKGEVAWVAPQGRRAYWRGVITALEFTMAR